MMKELKNEDVEFYKSILAEVQNAATWVPFGFEFQADSGIFLMMRFYDVIETIKMESSLQDVEITKKDGKLILAQAKSTQYPYGDNPNEKSKLTDALMSLLKSDNDNVEELIYISNLVDPLLSGEEHEFDDKLVKYEYLSKSARESISNSLDDLKVTLEKKISNEESSKRTRELSKAILYQIENLNKSKIEIITIPRYYGDDNRGIEIKRHLMEFLHDRFKFSDEQCASFGNEIYRRIHSFFVFQSSVSTVSNIKTIQKNVFAWFSIIVATEGVSPSEALEKLGEEYDDDIASRIQGYSYEFNNYLKYENLTHIIADYIQYVRETHKKSLDFINEKYLNYSSDFVFIEDIDERRMTIKSILYKIFKKYTMIKNITEGVK